MKPRQEIAPILHPCDPIFLDIPDIPCIEYPLDIQIFLVNLGLIKSKGKEGNTKVNLRPIGVEECNELNVTGCQYLSINNTTTTVDRRQAAGGVSGNRSDITS
ncbi:hypothetical protein J6590_105280, partial [Homalodisca vitripennis]